MQGKEKNKSLKSKQIMKKLLQKLRKYDIITLLQ